MSPNECGVDIRADVLELPNYVPGARALSAEVAKLSSNENPYPPPSTVVDAAQAALTSINRYPDMACHDLKEALATYHEVSSESIVLGTGSSALLIHAMTSVGRPGSKVIYPWRSFESYPIATVTSGSQALPVPLAERGRHDFDAMASAIDSNTSTVIVCSPNNPTGVAHTQSEIADFLQQLPSRVLVIIDEAYIDFATAPGVQTAIPLIKQFPNVVVARTFSKAFGLAGARVGYLVGHPHMIAAISKVATPFGVSSPAQALALAALGERAWFGDVIAQIVYERGRVCEALQGMGVDVWDTQANFFWIPADVYEPKYLNGVCRSAGLLVRWFPEGTRISLGTPEENDRLLNVFAALRNN